MDQVVQLAVSLGAIIAIVLLARQMKLGGDARILNETDARRLADEAIDGFAVQDVAIDRAGFGALLTSDDDRIMVLRRHGAHFAGRLLDSKVQVVRKGDTLILTTPDKRFGKATLDLGENAAIWATRLDRL